MIVVYVRHKDTKNMLGILWAKTHDDLWWNVDQFGDPSDFEWCLAGKRGGSLEIAGDVSIKKLRDSGAKITLDELAADALYRAKWKPFDFADVGHGGIAQIKRELEENEIISKLGKTDNDLDDWK